MASGVRSDTSKRLGSLLLKGWAMLAENCPDCQVPLMKERDVEERLCVNCDTTFVPDQQGLRPTSKRAKESPQPSTAREPSPLQPLHKQHEKSEQEDSGYNPQSDPRLGPFSAPADTPARTSFIGTRSPGTGRAAGLGPKPTTAAEPSPAKDRKDTEPIRSTAAPTVGSGLANGVGSTAAPSPSRPPTSDEVADLLSSKMLQGWALLDKYCPRCNTVLVRSKINKRMFCVACDAFVLAEEDVLQQQQQQQKQQQLPEQKSQPQQQQDPVALPPSPSAPTPSQNRSKLPTRIDQQPHPQQPQQQPAGVLHPVQGRSAFLSQSPSRQPQLKSQPLQPPSPTPSTAPLSVLSVPVSQLLMSQQQQQQVPGRLSSSPSGSLWGVNRVAGGGDGGGGGGDITVLSSVSRTVALKLLEAQGLLEATPAGDTERARSYVLLISSYLDVLAKVQGLQQQLA